MRANINCDKKDMHKICAKGNCASGSTCLWHNKLSALCAYLTEDCAPGPIWFSCRNTHSDITKTSYYTLVSYLFLNILGRGQQRWIDLPCSETNQREVYPQKKKRIGCISFIFAQRSDPGKIKNYRTGST